MKLIFSENAWEDYLYWQKTNKKILNRINKLIKETSENRSKVLANQSLSNTVSPGTGLGESTKNTEWFTKSRMTLCLSPSSGITTDITQSTGASGGHRPRTDAVCYAGSSEGPTQKSGLCAISRDNRPDQQSILRTHPNLFSERVSSQRRRLMQLGP